MFQLLVLSTYPSHAHNNPTLTHVENKQQEKAKAARGKLISSEITIHASPAKVWEILTDFEKYPTWNPFIKYVRGDMAKGNSIQVMIAPPGAKAMSFAPKVLVYDTCKELKWIGKLMVPGLFDGEHRFQIIDNGDGTITFIQSENFRGILVPFFKKMLDNNTLQGFKDMNQKLKELAEKGV